MADTHAELTEISDRLMIAIRDRDGNALDAILHPDFVQINESGTRTPRDAFIAAATSGDFTIRALSFEFLSVDPVDAVGVVCGVQRAVVALPSEEEVTGRTAFTDVFVKNAGRWRVRVATSADLP